MRAGGLEILLFMCLCECWHCAVDYLIWIHGIGAALQSTEYIRVVVLWLFTALTHRKLLRRVRRSWMSCWFSSEGKLNKLCVDSGLCRCVSRKKNAVLWFKTKERKEEKRKRQRLRKSIFSLPYSAMSHFVNKTI